MGRRAETDRGAAGDGRRLGVYRLGPPAERGRTGHTPGEARSPAEDGHPRRAGDSPPGRPRGGGGEAGRHEHGAAPERVGVERGAAATGAHPARRDPVGHRQTAEPPGPRPAPAADRSPARQGDVGPHLLRPLAAGRTRAGDAVPQAHGGATVPGTRRRVPAPADDPLDAGAGPRRRAAGQHHPVEHGQGGGHARERGEAAEPVHAAELPAGDGPHAPDPHPPERGRAPGVWRQGVSP